MTFSTGTALTPLTESRVHRLRRAERPTFDNDGPIPALSVANLRTVPDA